MNYFDFGISVNVLLVR